MPPHLMYAWDIMQVITHKRVYVNLHSSGTVVMLNQIHGLSPMITTWNGSNVSPFLMVQCHHSRDHTFARLSRSNLEPQTPLIRVHARPNSRGHAILGSAMYVYLYKVRRVYPVDIQPALLEQISNTKTHWAGWVYSVWLHKWFTQSYTKVLHS